MDPDSVVGHLLAGSLHAVFRDPASARASFARVLRLDPTHPRALLGLARIAIEEDDPRGAAELLRRALARYPDFPEAQALLAVITADAGPGTRPARTAPALRADRLRVPVESREMVVARPDGTLLLAQPRGPRSDEIAARTAQLYRLAAALVGRAGCGALRHAVVEGAAETTVTRADRDVLLSLTFGRDVALSAALAHLDRVWTHCRVEIGAAVA
jgi:predicted regulator of Ras-like GTPase activity (Roadblock/LC7/MglB family)